MYFGIGKFLNRMRLRRILKKYRLNDVEFGEPDYVSNFKNLVIIPPVYIGNRAWLSLRGKLLIDEGSIIGPRLKVHTSNHNWDGTMLPYDDKYIVKDVYIGKNVWIGADVTIMPGVTIGEGAIVAACACVTKNVPPLAVVGGCPARVFKYRDVEKYNSLKAADQIYLKLKKNGKTITDEKGRIIRTDNN